MAQVSVDNSESRTRVFRDSLPEEAVLSPVLFVIYLNGLSGRFRGKAFVSAYAEDQAIACLHRSKEQAKMDIQREVDLVSEWRLNTLITIVWSAIYASRRYVAITTLIRR